MSWARDHYKVFFDTSREGMYITTKEGYFVDANQSFCQLLGYTRLEILRMHAEDILALPIERRRFRHEIESNGSVTGFRIKLLSKTQDELHCSINASVLRDFQGEIDGYIGMVKQVKALSGILTPDEAEAQQFALAIRGGHDGLWDWDLRKNEVHYSSRWKAILGYASFELGKSVSEWFDRVHLEDVNHLKQTIQIYFKGETPLLSAYFRMRNKTGDYLWMLVRAVGDFDEKQKCVRLAGSLSNITSHIKMVESLKTQEEQLSQLNESLSHDRALLARYFSGDVLGRILSSNVNQSAETVGPAAILQVKIRGIHDLWTRIGNDAYASFLNEILTDLMDLVYGLGGSVNKILGDTLLVSFGCPLAQDDDLVRAVECAVEILQYRKTFNDVRPEFLTHDVRFAIGLAYGDVFSATLGSVHRLEYTLVGAPVTRAAALQLTAEKLDLALIVDQKVQETLRLRFDFVPVVPPSPAGKPPYPPLRGVVTLAAFSSPEKSSL